MKLFSAYLAEEEQKNHGTYASLSVDKACREKLHAWLKDNKIGGELLDSNDYHCTLVYSKKGVPQVSEIKVDLPIEAKPKEWKIFGDDKILVLVIKNQDIVDLFDETRKMGAESDYPSFIPHVSVSNHYKGEVPSNLPDFSIIFTKFKVNELDADFTYNED